MELRGYREGDGEALARLMVSAFGDGTLEYARGYFDPEKNPVMDLAGVHVVEEDGEARAGATVLPLEVFVDGRPAAMGGVAAVMAHPAYRRRGYAGALLRAVLARMRAEGTHLSMLWPFAHAFYRAYGWEVAGEEISYSLDPADLQTSPEQKHVRAYREGDFADVAGLCEGRAARHQLCVRRSEKAWRKVRGRGGLETAVYAREGGGVEGYVLYEMTGAREGRDPERVLRVEELVAGTRRAREALISFMAAQDPLVFGIEYSTPRGEPLHPYLKNSYVDAKVSPEFMLRLVDVEGALKLLDRGGSPAAPLTLEVADDVLPENTGTYTVAGGEVVRDAEADEKVALDVRDLAGLYAGYLSVPGLVRHGRIEGGSPEALELLEELFPPGDPWVSRPDHF